MCVCVCVFLSVCLNVGRLAVTSPCAAAEAFAQAPGGPSRPSQDFNVTLPRLAIHTPPGGLESGETHVESPVARCEGWKGVWVV